MHWNGGYEILRFQLITKSKQMGKEACTGRWGTFVRKRNELLLSERRSVLQAYREKKSVM